jgi:glutathione S-transferase
MGQRYQVIGMRGAGSLIAEFMLTAVGQDYDISFPEPDEMRQAAFRALNPLGKVPVLICPDGQTICETLAITAHLFEAFPQLAPPVGTAARTRHWQYLAMLATCIYPAYHRQHRTEYYAPETAFDVVRDLAVVEQMPAYDFIEETLCPFLCGATPFAADFYLYMLARWDLDRDGLLAKRPKLAAFMAAMRAQPAVDPVLAAQRRPADTQSSG